MLQLPAPKEMTEILLLGFGHLCRALPGLTLNADVPQFTSEIFTQQENNISFCVIGASLLALSASVCPKAEIVL